ncbi:hypothetical protein D3C76_648520 [compost metagenome]
MVDHLGTAQRLALAIEQAPQHGDRAQYAHLAVIDAAAVQVVVQARRLNHRGSGGVPLEIELHVAGLVGRDRDDVAPRVQVDTQRIVGAQLQVFDVGIHINDQRRLVRHVPAAHRRLAGAHRHHAFQVQPARELTVVGRALYIGVTVHYLVLELGVATQPCTITVGTEGGADTAQRPKLYVLLITQRSVEVTPAITRSAAADTGGQAAATATQAHAQAQVDAAAARVACAAVARPVEQRKPPVGIGAKQAPVIGPAQVNAGACIAAAAVGQAHAGGVAGVETVAERQRRLRLARLERPCRRVVATVRVGARQPAAAVAGDQRAALVGMDQLKVIAAAMALSLEQVAIQFEPVAHIPVQ